ncbi:MAG: hypothetical protein BMS9Abin30_0182 [Gammaproteobacteria bacterium]|nr:MAG: hypothetical protein BMS9Abin30_0182 [Gammaproteobacteria bacterium]
MPKFVLTSVSTALVTLFLTTAFAEEGTDIETASPGTPATEPVAETAVETGDRQNSIMDQPVDFSSPENVEKTLAAIRQQAGEKAAGSINNAIGYLIVYDLSVKRDKDKLYKRLNGKTPNEILALVRR